MEHWKDVKGYEGLYQVSNIGRIKALKKTDQRGYTRQERMMQPVINACGRPVVHICKSGKRKTVFVHRLIAEAFIPNPNNKPEVNHIDGNKSNNHISNLEWVTRSENLKHAVKHGLSSPVKAIEATKKKVELVDDNGNAIKRWNTMTAAADEMGVHISNVSMCCHGKLKSTGGHFFRFAD